MVDTIIPKGVIAAIRGNDIDKLRELLDAGADVNERAAPGAYTALMVAIDRFQLDMMELLIERGANLRATISSGKTVLDIARAQEEEEPQRMIEQALRDKEAAIAGIQAERTARVTERTAHAARIERQQRLRKHAIKFKL